MKNITSKQWFQIVSGIVSGLITGAALMETLWGESLTIQIVACLGIFNIMLSSVAVALSGQASLVKDVAAMPGVSNITVNPLASPALAGLAADASHPAVVAAPPTTGL